MSNHISEKREFESEKDDFQFQASFYRQVFYQKRITWNKGISGGSIMA